MVEKKQIPSIKEFIVIELEAVAVTVAVLEVVVVGFELAVVVDTEPDAAVVVVTVAVDAAVVVVTVAVDAAVVVVTVAVDAAVVVVSSLFTRMHKKSTKILARIKFFENIFKFFLIFLWILYKNLYLLISY